MQTAGPIEGSPTTFQNDVDHYGCVVFSSGDRKLYMYNAIADVPIIKWSIDLGGWSYSTCAVDYNALVRTSDAELVQKVIYTGCRIMGPYSQVKGGSRWTQLNGFFEKQYQECLGLNIAAGTSEIQRNIIAGYKLGIHST